jgi:hypothetical protein
MNMACNYEMSIGEIFFNVNLLEFFLWGGLGNIFSGWEKFGG